MKMVNQINGNINPNQNIIGNNTNFNNIKLGSNNMINSAQFENKQRLNNFNQGINYNLNNNPNNFNNFNNQIFNNNGFYLSQEKVFNIGGNNSYDITSNTDMNEAPRKSESDTVKKNEIKKKV